MTASQLFKTLTTIVSIIGLLIGLSETANSADKVKSLLVLCAYFTPFLAGYIVYEIVYSWIPKKGGKKKTGKSKKKSDPLPPGLQFSLILLIVMTIGATLLVKLAGFDNIVQASLPPLFQPLDPLKPEYFGKTSLLSTTGKQQQTVAQVNDQVFVQEVAVQRQLASTENTMAPKPVPAPAPAATVKPVDPLVQAAAPVKALMLPPVKTRVNAADEASSTLSSRVQLAMDEAIVKAFPNQPDQAKVHLSLSVKSKLINPVSGSFVANGSGVITITDGPTADCTFNWGRYSDYDVASHKIVEEIMPLIQHAFKERKVSCSLR